MPEIANAIDHLVIATPDLAATRDELIDLGFYITARAVHEKFGTENYLLVLDDAYLELLGVSGRRAEVRTTLDVLEPCLSKGGGAPMLALASDDMDASHARLSALGVEASAPMFWSRQADTPEGRKTASFTTMFVNSPFLPGFTSFYCRQHTVGYVRHRAWRDHINGGRRLTRIVRRSSAEHRSAREAAVLFGGVETAERGIEFAFGCHRLTYLHSNTLQTDVYIAASGTRAGAAKRLTLQTVAGVALVLHGPEPVSALSASSD